MTPSGRPLPPVRALRAIGQCVGLAVLLGIAGPTRAAVLADPTLRQLDEVARLIDKHYLRVIPADSLTDAARRCFRGKLDPYSSYLDAVETAEFEQELAGRFGGVGMVLALDSASAVIVVTALFRDSPALAAGVHAGDSLLAVGGKPTRGRTLEEVIPDLRGRVGTRARLRIHRPGESLERSFSIRRAAIESASVRGLTVGATDEATYLADVPTRTAYIRIEYFDKRTPIELDAALAAVERIGARALVLDLRDNPGGVVRSATGVADRLLDTATVVTMKERGEPDAVRRSDASVTTRIPLAVLINARTMSAAELLASSLQDNGRAVLVGSRTFGKGVALNLFHLKRTPGLVKLTTTEYLRPSGRRVERHFPGMDSDRGGVWPDSGWTIPLPEDEEERWADASYRVTARLNIANPPADTTAVPPDRVLARAVEALKASRPH